ncbi:rCG20551, isoform CRA_c [Rattus norvegicus]|uniref:Mitochondrial import inner membrane translocase subunit Tim21 n=1 Tax=Rattus norvegicus TaxID=10116 RepID=A6K5M4_RAT|nr:rCG20551, isoform CRA_c [Rattus norvegicus]
MICAFLRVVRHAEKLHGSLGRQLLLPHFVLTKACLKTQPLRWGLREQKKTVQPRTVLGFTQKTFWTQGPDPRKAKEDSSKQVSINRNQREETGVSTSQKVKEAGRDVTYLIVVLFGVSITGSLLYTIFKELFSSSSPNIIYGKALGKCRTHPEVSFLMIVWGRRNESLVKPMPPHCTKAVGCFSVFRSLFSEAL